MLIAQIEDLVKIWRPYHLYFPRYKPSKSITVESGQFTVLNDSASPKKDKTIFKFFPIFLKGFRAVWMSMKRPICNS